MGYSSPKKQLDLKEFLSQPSIRPKSRNFWRRSAVSSEKKAKDHETETNTVSDKSS